MVINLLNRWTRVWLMMVWRLRRRYFTTLKVNIPIRISIIEAAAERLGAVIEQHAPAMANQGESLTAQSILAVHCSRPSAAYPRRNGLPEHSFDEFPPPARLVMEANLLVLAHHRPDVRPTS